MSIDELKAVFNNCINLDGSNQLRVKINYKNGVGYAVKDVNSFQFMNGGIVLNIDVDYVPES